MHARNSYSLCSMHANRVHFAKRPETTTCKAAALATVCFSPTVTQPNRKAEGWAWFCGQHHASSPTAAWAGFLPGKTQLSPMCLDLTFVCSLVRLGAALPPGWSCSRRRPCPCTPPQRADIPGAAPLGALPLGCLGRRGGPVE